MGNFCSCLSHDETTAQSEKHESGPSQSPRTALPTLQDHIQQFKERADTWDVDDLIQAIDQLLKSKLNGASTTNPDTPSGSKDLLPNFISAIDSGSTFLKFLNEHTGKIHDKDDFFRSGQGQQVVEEILQQLGQLHWVVGGLSVIAYLLRKVDKVLENRSECLQLLKCMFRLVNGIKKLEDQMFLEEETLRDAYVLIVEGSMECASQLRSGKFFRFLKSSVDSQALNILKTKINKLYGELTLDTVIDINKKQPVYLPVLLPKHPEGAVGLEKPLEELKEKLDLQTPDVSPRAVVIYGFGGIGKTTLANALVAALAEDLKDHRYTNLQISEDPLDNDFKSMQQQILRDCFPRYEGGRQILLRDSVEGQRRLKEAFNSETKPVFIFIDNVLRPKYLKVIFPKELLRLPPRSRILVTTRNLAATQLFEDCRIPLHSQIVNPLAEEHALKILCDDPAYLYEISNHVENITRIAGGIPLVLEILGAHLRKQKYKVQNCSILKTLETGDEVTEEDLSQRVINCVYNDLERSTREAFLDICFYFNGWSRRYVEYIVGAEEVASLEDAALLTSIPYDDLTGIWKENISLLGEHKLIVHDFIQARGRSMGKPTRMKDLRSFNHQVGLGPIQGAELHSHGDVIEESDLSFTGESLRTLILGDSVRISSPSSQIFKELRCLRIGPGISPFPMNLEGLPSLFFYEGPIFNEVLSKLPQNLKCLFAAKNNSDVDECSSLEHSVSIQAVRNSSLEALELSDVENMRVMLDGRLHFDALKILLLSGWKKMEELPRQVCGLLSLNKLILRECESLKRLPESIANLKALTHLDLRWCHKLEVISSLGELMALRYLDLGHCSALRELPDNFGRLSALEYLSLEWCLKLEALPGNFAQLKSLKGLDLSRCGRLKQLPSCFIRLPTLKVLWMYGVDKLLEPLSPIDNNWKIIH